MKLWINSRKPLSTFGVLLGSDYEHVLLVYCSVHCCLWQNVTHLETKCVIQQSHASRWLLFKCTEKEWGHYIISRHWLSNLLSFFLRSAFIFLGCDPTATGQQLAERAEREFMEKAIILKTLTHSNSPMLTHKEVQNFLTYDFKASSHITQPWSNQLYTN